MTRFRDFITASSLNRLNQTPVVEALEHPVTPHTEADVEHAAAPTPLKRRRSRLLTLERRRNTSRNFSPAPLRASELSRLFTSFATQSARRTWHGVTGTPASSIYVCCLHAQPQWQRQILHYDPERHAVTVVGPCPEWDTLAPELGLSSNTPSPVAVLIVINDPRSLLNAFGERGGRFALIEAAGVVTKLELAAADLAWSARQLGAYNDDALLQLCCSGLTIAQTRHYVVGGVLTLGKPIR